jgi:hypothetical protein
MPTLPPDTKIDDITEWLRAHFPAATIIYLHVFPDDYEITTCVPVRKKPASKKAR